MNQHNVSWMNHFMWRCSRHIPSSMTFPAFVDRCTMCQHPRPEEWLRPNLDGSLPLQAPRPVREPPIIVMEARPEPVEVPEVAPPEPIPEVIPLPDDYQLVMISLVSEGGHPIQVAPPAPLDSIPLTIEAPPAPTEEPKMMVETGFSDQELAIAAEQYRQVSDQPDPPDVPKTNGNGKVKHLCPGPKCRRVSRKGSPYCSTVCKDRCYRLRKKAFRAILTEAETTRLHRILVALEAWYGEAGDGGVVETPSPKSAAPV